MRLKKYLLLGLVISNFTLGECADSEPPSTNKSSGTRSSSGLPQT